jgi:hypothetical protein
MSSRSEPTTLLFHPLSFLPERDEVVVGRTDVDSYGVFPADGAALLRELIAGRSPEAAAAWYTREYDDHVDMDEFLATLRELDFLRVDTATGQGRAPVRWQRLGRALFSAPAWVCYVLLLGAALATYLADPRLLPNRHHVFFSPYLVVIELVLIFGQFPLSLLHESFHVLAGRRLGLRSRMRLGRRLYFVVFETAIDGLVIMPKRQRYLPMIAGIFADLLAVAGLTVVAFLTRHPEGELSLAGQICLALVFTAVLRIAWQFYFFLRTDIYYLVTTVLGCVDLHTTSSQVLRNRFNRFLGRTDRIVDEDQWHPRDRQVARWYAPLHAVGYLVMFAVLAFAVIPIGWRFLTTAFHTLFAGDATPMRLVDAAVMLAINFGQLTLAAVMFIRERRRVNANDTLNGVRQ